MPHSNRLLTYLSIGSVLFVSYAVYRQYQAHSLPWQGTPADANALPATWPCTADANRLCPNVPRGKGRVNACLREHEKMLTSECLDYLEMVDPSNDWSNVCREELHTFCGGRGKPMRCLHENRSRLSSRCAALLDSYDAMTQMNGACGYDVQRLCAEVPADQATAVTACLREHEKELSFSCRFYLAARKSSS
jgi:hypothetical protein